MSGISLDKFQQIQTTEKVVLGQGNGEVDRKQEGNLFGKLVSWVSRIDAKRTANNEVTKAFFDSLEKTYGTEVKDYAIEGYESRLEDGKPLSGRRIQQILARAGEGQDGLSNEDAKTVKARLFDQKKHDLMNTALEPFNIPEGSKRGWTEHLLRMLPEGGLSEDRDPLQYDTEFQNLIGHFVESNRELLQGIAPLEAKRQALFGHEGYDWGNARQEVVERYAFPREYRDMFVKGFGTGEGKTNDVDVYFRETVLPGAKKGFTVAFGEKAPEKMPGYDEARTREDRTNNGTYFTFPLAGAKFLFVQQINSGSRLRQEEELRGEKFHISVQPEDLGKVFDALSPLLTREDCPFPMWKTVDIDNARATVDKQSTEMKRLQDLKDEDPDAFTPEQQKQLDACIDNLERAQRMLDGCQITLYLDPDGEVDDPRVSDLLKAIETTLAGLDIQPLDTPESDEPVGRFVSFRVGHVTYREGDDGYTEALGRNPRKNQGDPVTEYIDPLGEGYEQIKKTLPDNPHYRVQGQVVVGVHTDEITRLRGRLEGVGNDRTGFDTVAREMLELGQKIGSLHLPDAQREELYEAYGELREQFNDEVRRQAGVSDRSQQLIGNAPIDERSRALIGQMRTSTFDDLEKVRIEQLVILQAQLMAAASNPDTPILDRLRMAGELDFLRDELSTALSTQRRNENVDPAGLELIRDLAQLTYKPDLGDIGDNYRQIDGRAIPDTAQQVSEWFVDLGVALELLDRGLPLIDEEKAELTELLDGLDLFFEHNQAVQGFGPSSQTLRNGVDRLRAAFELTFGPPERN